MDLSILEKLAINERQLVKHQEDRIKTLREKVTPSKNIIRFTVAEIVEHIANGIKRAEAQDYVDSYHSNYSFSMHSAYKHALRVQLQRVQNEISEAKALLERKTEESSFLMKKLENSLDGLDGLDGIEGTHESENQSQSENKESEEKSNADIEFEKKVAKGEAITDQIKIN